MSFFALVRLSYVNDSDLISGTGSKLHCKRPQCDAVYQPAWSWRLRNNSTQVQDFYAVFCEKKRSCLRKLARIGYSFSLSFYSDVVSIWPG